MAHKARMQKSDRKRTSRLKEKKKKVVKEEENEPEG